VLGLRAFRFPLRHHRQRCVQMRRKNEKNYKIEKKSARWQMKTMLMRIAVDVANEVAAETAANGG